LSTSKTAVLVVDAQNGLLSGPTPVYQSDALVASIQALLARARAAGVPVIYTQDKDVGPLNHPDWEIHQALAPHAGEVVIQKAYADSFFHTDLHQLLTERAIRQLIVVGCKTDSCVEMTCRRAVSLGYGVILPSDGHSTTDNSFMPAAVSIAYYNRILDGFGLEDGFGNGEREILVVPMAEIEL
jgi:nicotinamidase-related amidase